MFPPYFSSLVDFLADNGDDEFDHDSLEGMHFPLTVSYACSCTKLSLS